VPFLTYGFLGVEIVTVTAYEAKRPRQSLAFSARWIAWLALALFTFAGVGEALSFAWDNADLPLLHTRAATAATPVTAATTTNTRHFSILVMATYNAGYPRLAGFFNGCLIFTCLTAGNTGLYVASRVLYGLAREERPGSREYLKWMAKLNRFNVPFWALIVSAASFYWLPFVQQKKGYSVESVRHYRREKVLTLTFFQVFTVVITIGSVGTVLVWASQCLAYIRYWFWLNSHKARLADLRLSEPTLWQKYDRWMPNNSERYQSLLWEMQPGLAFAGLTFCLLTVFLFSTATWWNGDFTALKFFTALGGVSVWLLVVLWLSH
jgi:yeast amino acid transporter